MHVHPLSFKSLLNIANAMVPIINNILFMVIICAVSSLPILNSIKLDTISNPNITNTILLYVVFTLQLHDFVEIADVVNTTYK